MRKIRFVCDELLRDINTTLETFKTGNEAIKKKLVGEELERVSSSMMSCMKKINENKRLVLQIISALNKTLISVPGMYIVNIPESVAEERVQTLRECTDKACLEAARILKEVFEPIMSTPAPSLDVRTS